MENMGKHEYMESMTVKTWMFFQFGKKEGFYTYTDNNKKKGGELRPTDRPWFFSYVTANRHIF